MPTVAELQSIFEAATRPARERFAQFPWHSKYAYSLWLAQTYRFVCHTTRLLSRAASAHAPGDDEAHRQILTHLREESGHDLLALRDLKALGARAEDFPELVETSIFYQTQYFWIDHVTPAALSGYALFLESLAANDARGLAEVCEGHHGKGTASFLRVHGADDVEHVERGLTSLAAGSEVEVKVVLRNLEQSAWLYCAMLDRIVTLAKATEVRKPAAA